MMPMPPEEFAAMVRARQAQQAQIEALLVASRQQDLAWAAILCTCQLGKWFTYAHCPVHGEFLLCGDGTAL